MANHRLPNQSTRGTVDLEELFTVAKRLNQLLLTECDLLTRMQLRELAKFHDEKTALSAQLDVMQQAVASDIHILEHADAEVRERVCDIAISLAQNIEENLRLTALAQTVNRSVMQTFVEAIAQVQQVNVYSRAGEHDHGHTLSVSLTLNERA